MKILEGNFFIKQSGKGKSVHRVESLKSSKENALFDALNRINKLI
jgi:hypothetical protein